MHVHVGTVRVFFAIYYFPKTSKWAAKHMYTWQYTDNRVPVSQIWALMVLVSTWILLVANSTPMVDLDSRLNSLRVNRERRLDFPTPESPINTTVCVKGVWVESVCVWRGCGCMCGCVGKGECVCEGGGATDIHSGTTKCVLHEVRTPLTIRTVLPQ